MRESGLKLNWLKNIRLWYCVSLHAREWIEIIMFISEQSTPTVSLHAREWIEIANKIERLERKMSLSMRESGLKLITDLISGTY